MNWLRRSVAALTRFLVPRPAVDDDVRLKVVNLSRSTVLATDLEVAGSGKKRRKGLLGRDGLSPGEGLWIVPCESVHTFFMRFPIDLIYLDRSNKIRKVKSNVAAWRLSACVTAHSVLELPAGTVRQSETQRGDMVEFIPLAAEDVDQ